MALAASWQSLIESVVAQHGRLDLLCNIAGIIEPDWVDQASIDSIDRHIDINVKGVLYGTKLAAEQMVRQGSGHIINMASLAGSDAAAKLRRSGEISVGCQLNQRTNNFGRKVSFSRNQVE